MIAPVHLVGPSSRRGHTNLASALIPLLAVLLVTAGCSAAQPQPDFPVNDPSLITDLDAVLQLNLRDPATNSSLFVPSTLGFWDSAAQRLATSPPTAPAPSVPGIARETPSSDQPLAVVLPTAPIPEIAAADERARTDARSASGVALGAGVSAAEGAAPSPTPTTFDTPGLSARATGRLFFTSGGRPRSCTASVVNSGAPVTVVITAAHCLLSDGSDGPRVRSENILFVPGYRDGQEPYGRLVAGATAVTDGWTRETDWSNDVGFVALIDQRLPSLPDGLGAYGLVFGAPAALGRVDLLGYPSVAPFDGSRARICRGVVAGVAGDSDPADPDSQPLPCQMTAGYSGGPAVAGALPGTAAASEPAADNPGAAGSYIVGIGSHDYGAGTIFMSPLGEQALAAFRELTR